ncbi:uncharacterized protein LOC132194783 [Neocloeon triangulifer]|uniref:uncharacterized protein LOC132194783 n=1 Tax=Neocloeon triangulifer TaxID=2078957 RepID=UPI00286F2455|nr:uncharacterized protein LOC132194783 [Neocloeon triangulifer]
MAEEKIKYRWLFASFGLLTVVYLLSEYIIYKVDVLLEENFEDFRDNLEFYTDEEGEENPFIDRVISKEKTEVNSTIIKTLLGLLAREKRQSPSTIPVIPGFVCTADLFKKVDPCCPTPVFLKESELQNCNRRRFARSANESSSKNLSQSEIELGYDQGVEYDYYDPEQFAEEKNESQGRPGPHGAPSYYFRWSPVRIIQVPQRRYSANRASQRAQAQTNLQAAIIGRKTSTRQICMVDCMFRTLKWISQENSLNVDLMFAAMTAMVPTAWGTLLASAKTDCASVTAGGGMIENVLDANRKVCLVAPIKLMRCIKRYLIANCPSLLDSGSLCTANTNVLRQCDVLAV